MRRALSTKTLLRFIEAPFNRRSPTPLANRGVRDFLMGDFGLSVFGRSRQMVGCQGMSASSGSMKWESTTFGLASPPGMLKWLDNPERFILA